MFLSLNEDQQTAILETYVINKSKELDIHRRNIMQSIAEIKFALILSKKWFKEFSDFDENKLSLNIDDNDVQFTFDMFEKEEKI